MNEKFQEFEKKLAAEYPNSIADAKALSNATVDPSKSDAETCWSVMWDKPLYANAIAKSVNSKVQKAKSLMNDSWRTIGDPGIFLVLRKSGVAFSKTTAVENFDFSGRLARELMKEPFNFPPHRLMAIQGAALALQVRNARNPASPFVDLAQPVTRQTLLDLRKEFGFGWGHITLLHLLTDLGVGCKPDRHLVRSLEAIGYPLRDKGDKTPSVTEAVAMVAAVRDLSTAIFGNADPKNLRYTDKVLMEISERLLSPSSNKRPRKFR